MKLAIRLTDNSRKLLEEIRELHDVKNLKDTQILELAFLKYLDYLRENKVRSL